jgi:large subunit ribosomal protein L15
MWMAEKFKALTLSNLSPARGSTAPRKRVGRGPGSGLGKTSGKGHKGHKARTGGQTNPGFEGGQMPMYRRLPKRGFTNPFKVITQSVNLGQLKKVSTTDVSPEMLYSAGLIAKVDAPVKLLGTGDADRAYTVRGVALSASARAKIEAAGGKIEG